MNLTIVMRPVNISLAKSISVTNRLDEIVPFGLRLSELALAEEIILNVTQNTLIESGWYTVRAADIHFNSTFHLKLTNSRRIDSTLETTNCLNRLIKKLNMR